MKFGNVSVNNFEGAFRGMRNPLNSWNKSDSEFGIYDYDYETDVLVGLRWARNRYPDLDEDSIEFTEKHEAATNWLKENQTFKNSYEPFFIGAYIGPNDMDLAQRLCKAGPEHRKFLRQIQVCVDIIAPLYWWKEFDTYKIGTVANSTSTMHKLASTSITIDCFEISDYEDRLQLIDPAIIDVRVNSFLDSLEQLRQLYNQTKDKRYWKELVRWLPSGWLQTRTVTLNYENLRSICAQRENHKLTEWHQFVDWVHTLPYANELIFDQEVAF